MTLNHVDSFHPTLLKNQITYSSQNPLWRTDKSATGWLLKNFVVKKKIFHLTSCRRSALGSNIVENRHQKRTYRDQFEFLPTHRREFSWIWTYESLGHKNRGMFWNVFEISQMFCRRLNFQPYFVQVDSDHHFVSMVVRWVLRNRNVS